MRGTYMGICDSWYEKLKNLFYSNDTSIKTDDSDEDETDDTQSNLESDVLDSLFIPGSDKFSEDKNNELLDIIKEGISTFFDNRHLILCKQSEIDSLKSKIKSLEQQNKIQQEQIDSASSFDPSVLDDIKQYMDNSSMEISVSDIRVKSADGNEKTEKGRKIAGSGRVG